MRTVPSHRHSLNSERLTILASACRAVSVAAAEAAKSLVAVVKSGGGASVPSIATRAGGLLAVRGTLTDTVRAVSVGASEGTEAAVVVRQAGLDLAGSAEGTGRSRGGNAGCRGRGRGGSGGNALLLDVGGAIICVQLEVVGVGILAHRASTVAIGTDGVLAVAPRAQDTGKVVQIGEGRARASHLAAVGRSGFDVVALVGNVGWVTEKECSANWDGLATDFLEHCSNKLTLAAGRGSGIEARISENVANNIGTFAVATQDDLGIGALRNVGLDLGNAGGSALLNRIRVTRGV